MKFQKFLIWVLTLALVTTLSPSVALAQTPGAGVFDTRAIPVGIAQTADNTVTTAVLIKYVGTSVGYITVAADGNLTFEVGDTSTVDTNIECDASIAAAGSRNGIIDVSVAACNTWGEVVELINQQSDDWVAIPVDVAFGDSSDNAAVAATDQSASTADGYAVLINTADAVWLSSFAMLPNKWRTSIAPYLSQASSSGAKIKPDPYAGYVPTFFYANATSTYGSGTSTYSISCYRTTFSGTQGTASWNWNETTEASFGGIAGGATTAQAVFDDFTFGLQCPANTRMIARLTNSAAMSSVSHYAYAKLFPAPAGVR